MHHPLASGPSASPVEPSLLSAAPSVTPRTPSPPGGSPTLPAAVLWDMDGTLVDTERYWLGAETDLVAEFGGTWTYEDGLTLIGTPLLTSAKVFQDLGVPLSSEEIVRRLIQSVVDAVGRELVWQPGAQELLVGLRDAGVPCALVTMSYRVLAEAVVAQGPPGVFSVVVTGDEVTHGKPHPEPYLKAAEELGVDITECVAVEDSPPGIGSAVASGARTLGVQHIVPVEARDGLSRASTLEGITPETLGRIAAGEVIDRLA